MSYNDAHVRKQLTPPMKDLLAEYERCTNRTVHLDYARVSALTALDIRGVTVDGMFTVIRYVSRLIRTGENRRKVGTFTPASLEFMNLCGDTSRFMDRLQTAREELVANRIVKNKTVAVTRGEITRLEEVRTERAPEAMRNTVVEALRAIADNL